MKAVLVTTHRAINYGAVLQAYALQQFMKECGVDNEILEVPAKKTMITFPTKALSRSGLIKCYSDFLYLMKQGTMKRMLRRFDDFILTNMDRTRVYENIEAINEKPPRGDFYINGSDQVFAVRGKQDRIRMLDFGAPQTLRFSYAASLGEYDWSEEEKQIFLKHINKFSLVSVRETYAKEYIESFFGRKCEVNIDPVFLLEKSKWETFVTRKIDKEPYILCYALLSNYKTQQVIDELKKQTGLKVVYVHTLPAKRLKADRYVFDAGPQEFLDLLVNAEYVVTTSFHGTAFSMLFHKKFYTLIKDYKAQRITGLFEKFHLSERIISDVTVINQEEIDYSYCDEAIKEEREKSKAYIGKIMECVRNSDS